jgi:hypothetical protein
MSYLDQTSRNKSSIDRRRRTILHVGFGYLIVSGLAYQRHQICAADHADAHLSRIRKTPPPRTDPPPPPESQQAFGRTPCPKVTNPIVDVEHREGHE